jgi:hypothetical protein
MNDVTATPAELNVQEQPSELDLLKQRANLMGISFHPNIGLPKLKAKVNAALAPSEEAATINAAPTADPYGETVNGESVKEIEASGRVPLRNGKPMYLTHEQFTRERTANTRKNLNRLVRVVVNCMNPNKTEWEGELMSVGSAKAGTFKKFVPFNQEEGFHIPYIIYQAMVERKYSKFYTVKGPRGEKIRKGRLVPEFNIEVLDPLTPQELKDLAQRQAMSGSIDSNNEF